MGLRIRTNVASLKSQRNLQNSSSEMQKHLVNLASGYRINKAADDAAGLAISTNLRAEIRGLNQAKRNTHDGISLIQTAEGGLYEIQNILVRLRELSVQSASDTIGSHERNYLHKEYSYLTDEIERISLSTDYNGTRLLVGDPSKLDYELQEDSNYFPLEIQVGPNYNPINDSLEADNPLNIIRIDLNRINSLPNGEDGLDLVNKDNSEDEDSNDQDTGLTTKEKAHEAINKIDSAITKVSEYRAYLGSMQNRLTSTVNNLNVSIESLSSAKSRILDVDYAEESAEFTQSSILVQSGVAVLSQANQLPEMALALLN